MDAKKPFSFKKFFTFKGRVSFSQFWWFFFFVTITFWMCVAIDTLSKTTILTPLFIIIAVVPYLSYSVRRLHDINKRGWWVLLDIIPVFGFLYLLALFVRVGDDGSNRFGPPVDEFDD